MGTSNEMLRQWFDNGLRDGEYTHMIIVWDTFDGEDYPRYFRGTAEECRKEVDALERRGRQNMEKVMEVYDLSKDKDEQTLGSERVWNY